MTSKPFVPRLETETRKPCECGCGEYPKTPEARYCPGHQNGQPFRYGVIEGVHYDVDPATGCWDWRGFKLNGYAAGGPGGPVHRRVYEMRHGEIPAEDDCHHVCRNAGCINPDHMEVINRNDHRTMHAQGRSPMTPETVVELRELRAAGWTLEELSERFGIVFQKVSEISRGLTWQNVGGPRYTPPVAQCEVCGSDYERIHPNGRYCSKRCKTRANYLSFTAGRTRRPKVEARWKKAA